MANLTKIILGLNILAGGAGIFFGVTKSGQASELVKNAKTAEEDAAKAEGKVTGLEKDKADLATKFGTADSDAKAFKAQLDQIKASGDNKDTTILQLQSAKSALDTQVKTLTDQVTKLQVEANKVTQAQTDLARVEQEKAALQTELDKLKNPVKPKDPVKPKPSAGGFVGKITNIDPKYGFITINIGSSQGYKVGDRFHVYRNRQIVGCLKIHSLKNTGLISVARQETEGTGFPLGMQLQATDDLLPIN